MKRPPAAALAALALGMLLEVGPAVAAVDCTVAVSGVAFGTYDPLLATADDSTGSVTVTCTYIPPGSATNASYTVTLSPGSSGAFSSRQMAAGALRLGYNLFSDPGRSQVWGNASGGTTIISGTLKVGPGVGNGTRTQTHVVYGRVPALQNADPGNYSDSIQVTLTF